MGTNPNLSYGQVLTPAQWNNLFAAKQDDLGFTPLAATAFLRGTFTLTQNATSTAVSVTGLLSTSLFKWWPATANAAAITPFLYLPLTGIAGGVATLHHPSNPNSDLIFTYEVSV